MDETAWTARPVLRLVDRRLGDDPPDETQVRLLQDTERLYIGATLQLSQASEAVAQAQGRENPAVEQDDMFLCHLRPPDRMGYIELAINPKGSMSSQADVLRKRGFFPSHPVIPWETDGVTVASTVNKEAWTVEIAIPWQNLPGVSARPRDLRAQFIRWCRKDQHHFHCWSPVLSSWDYPLSRFGRVTFHALPIESLTILPKAQQAGRVAAVAQKPEQPTDPEQSPPKHDVLIVGQRDIGGRSWVEQRTVLIFDIAAIQGGPDDVAAAQLQVQHINAVHSPPYDNIIVDHVLGSDRAAVQPADFRARTLRPDVGTIIHAQHVGTAGTYRLDVTDCIRADLAAGRSVSTFRLRVADGCTCSDGKPHYAIFRGVDEQNAAEAPALLVESYQPEPGQ